MRQCKNYVEKRHKWTVRYTGLTEIVGAHANLTEKLPQIVAEKPTTKLLVSRAQKHSKRRSYLCTI